ncbi:hypothetical protein ACWOAH_05600 [Vagococcus vulneris]|uniref:Uncharacterized protein n=1 Tax=Vagococcus vulneris TaxID=1977869 RepID=A0A429ZZG0_9ENTE|nr:hypothetical protein [Vagococcus vulneris]RST99360.1 hypothetical protein CBF37_05155 [Vagococcus vulneris]
MSYKGRLIISVAEPFSLPQTLLFKIQHVLAMDVYMVPFIIVIVVGFSGKLAMLISSISSAVIDGAFVVTLGLILILQDFIKALPVFIQYLFSSLSATVSTVAMVLNKVLPEYTQTEE